MGLGGSLGVRLSFYSGRFPLQSDALHSIMSGTAMYCICDMQFFKETYNGRAVMEYSSTEHWTDLCVNFFIDIIKKNTFVKLERLADNESRSSSEEPEKLREMDCRIQNLQYHTSSFVNIVSNTGLNKEPNFYSSQGPLVMNGRECSRTVLDSIYFFF